ncbi:UPF0192 protein all5100 precursor [Geminocystis sp. NIES-3708]|uniref:alpha-2-macroglobulin family protein n=1 Tax=Geminocystis sp. NIES-3708 TaxID=1615909 RepID=UPI0005FCAC03|nr:alpha-2-macroglobulin [Geminocystis sp. NIES-3708]BAQ59792.1 UPF0192 protein all5100 precursor [Geminocystis sp. NIES-3708]
MSAKGKTRKIIKYGKYLILSIIACIFIVGCNLLSIQEGKEPLPSVSSIPLPTLPNWIEQITPIDEAKPLSQILIRFKNPLTPLEKLDTPEQENLLTKFEILPPLPGQFRILTPKMVGFQADQALPKATRIKVTLKAGLSDLKNNTLEEDLAWTFNTETIKLTNLPGKTMDSDEEVQPIDIKPNLEFTSNVELDLHSLTNKISLNSSESQEKINVTVALKPKDKNTEYTEDSSEKFDPSSPLWIYTLKPQKTLNKATNYQLEFAPGLLPLNGNLPSQFPFSSKLFTYAPLAFDKIENYGKPDQYGVYGRFVNGSPQLKFNNGLIAKSVIENITINPTPKKAIKLLQTYDEDNIVSFNPWALEANTNYTITINSKLQDKFDQTLDKPLTLKYQTGDIAPEIWAPSELNIFPSETDLQLNISTVNLPNSQYQATYKVIQPEDLVYSESAYPTGQNNDLLPNSKTWSTFTAKGKKNEVYDNVIPLKEKLNNSKGILAYGVKAKTNSYNEKDKILWREPEYYGLVQLTNLGVFSQWFPESGLIKVYHLSDGLPVNNATVEIYLSKLENTEEKYPPQPCAISQTDETGTIIFDGEKWSNCLINNEPPKLLVIAKKNDDWAFARTNEYSGAYEYGINAGWDDKKPISRGIIFSDRQLYQPQETAYFTGTAYYLKNGILQQDKNILYQVTLTNPDGKKVDLGTQTTNEFGTFSLELPLAKNQPLGNYSLVAKGETGVEIYGDFRVAEFKPPNFKVDLKLDQEFAFINEKITVNTESNYFFGSPVQGGKINYYVTRQKANFTPKNWDKFNFGRQWFFPEEEPEVPNDVLQDNQILDKTGKNTQQIAVSQDLPYPMTYLVEAQVSDISNLSVSNSKTFTALPSDKLIGLQSDFVANAGQSFPVKLIVTDATGKVITGEKVKVELQSMNYSSVMKLEEGSRIANQQIEYKTVAQQDIMSSNEPQIISFTPSDSGSYRIQANFINSNTDITATDSQIWVTGENQVNWADSYDSNQLKIELDKDTYQVGETATALIQSPYPEGELYFAVIRHDIIYHTTQKVTGGAPKVQFTVTPEMLPNAAVEAVLVRQGTPLTQMEAGNVKNLVRIGFTPFNLNLDEQYLQVKVTPQETITKPTTEQTINLELKDYQGNPIEGQFTLMAVNEAILQLTGYSPPDLVKTVYADQDISTRLADNRPQVVLNSPASPLQKGWGYGGGDSAGIANTQIRKDFRALAYYNGSILTDSNGKASINFTLPDDLTTWRLMAIATDGNLHFGNAETTFITQKPLSTNPILPQFVRLGDQFLGGLSVTNLAEKSGYLSINSESSNNFKFTKESQLKTQAESGTKIYTFPITVSKIGEGKIQFLTNLNNQEKDAFETPLEVKNLDITEQLITSGKIENEITIPLNINNQVIADAGGLEISLANTLIPNINLTAKQIFDNEEYPFLESSANRLMIAANLQILKEKGKLNLTDFQPIKKANEAIENLEKLQKEDGGFTSFPQGEKSDPFLTPYVANSLVQAKLAGFKIDKNLLTSVTNYLEKILANPDQDNLCNNLICKNQIRLNSLIALDNLGQKRTDFLQSIYEQKDELDFVNQIKLARYLSQFPEWTNQAENLINNIQESIYQTGRNSTVNLPSYWSWLDSNTIAQAEALRLFITKENSSENIDRLLEGLLAMRRNGVWNNNYENAQALTALVEYSQLESIYSNFQATVKLNNQLLENVKFQGYKPSNYDINISNKNLPNGKNNLKLSKSGEGILHYLTAYKYRLLGNQPGCLNGLRVTRYIHPVNQQNIIEKLGLYAPDKLVTLPVGNIFDLELEIITDHPVNHLIINDYLPAGLEAIDSNFQTSSNYFQAQEDSWQINYQQIYKDKIVAYGDQLEAGVYHLHYLVRSVTKGTFEWPGAEVHLQYAPEEFGRTASAKMEIK